MAIHSTATNATAGVFGFGPMGLGAAVIAARPGAKVIAVDPIAYRREPAEKPGARETIDPTDGDVVEQIRERTGGYGLDPALECAGKTEALNAALDLVRPFGHAAIVGADVGPGNSNIVVGASGGAV